MRRIACLSLVAAACAPDDVARIELSGDVLLIATVGEERRILSTRTAIAPADLPITFPSEQGSRLAVFALDRSQLITAGGLEPTDELLRQLVFEPAAGSAGCPCKVPALRAPQVLMPGQSCAPPEFARADLFTKIDGGFSQEPDDTALAELRAGLRLTWPGDCAPSLAEPIVAPEVKMCPLLPREGPLGTGIAVMHEDGAVLGISEAAMWIADPGGELRSAEFDPALPAYLRAVVALPGAPARFLYAVRTTAGAFRGTLYEVVGADLSREPISDATLLYLDPSQLTLDRQGTALFAAGPSYSPGAQTTTTWSIVRCPIDPTGAIGACAAEPAEPATCDLWGARVAFAENGAGVAFGEFNVAFRPAGEARWICDSAVSNGLIPVSNAAPIQKTGTLASLAAFGDRIFACFETPGLTDTDTDRAVVSVEAPANGPSSPPQYFASVLPLPRATCGRVYLRLSEYPDRLVFTLGDRGAVALDRGGFITESFRTDFAPLGPGSVPSGPPLFGGQARTTNYLVAHGEKFGYFQHSSLFRRVAPGEMPRLAYGEAIGNPFGNVALTELDDDSAAIIRDRAAPLRISKNGSRCEDIGIEEVSPREWTLTVTSTAGVTRETSAAFPSTVDYTHTTLDRRHPDRVVALAYDAGRFYADTIDLAAGTIDRTPRERYAYRSAELAPGRLIVIGEAEIYTIEADGHAETLVELDGAPPERESWWRAVAGRDGIGWAVGHDSLARIVPVPGGHRAETGLFAALTDPRFSYEFEEVVVAASGEVLIAGRAALRSDPGDYLLAIWRLAPIDASCTPEGGTAAGLMLCSWPGYLESVMPPDSDQIPSELVERDGVVSMFFLSSTTVVRNSPQRIAAPFYSTARARALAGWMVFSGPDHFGAAIEEGAE